MLAIGQAVYNSTAPATTLFIGTILKLKKMLWVIFIIMNTDLAQVFRVKFDGGDFRVTYPRELAGKRANYVVAGKKRKWFITGLSQKEKQVAEKFGVSVREV